MIEVKNVSMSFRLSQDRIQSIKEYLVALAKGKLKYKEFWALKDVLARCWELLAEMERAKARF